MKGVNVYSSPGSNLHFFTGSEGLMDRPRPAPSLRRHVSYTTVVSNSQLLVPPAPHLISSPSLQVTLLPFCHSLPVTLLPQGHRGDLLRVPTALGPYLIYNNYFVMTSVFSAFPYMAGS